MDFSEEPREALRELAEARGTLQSALIREALESFLQGADTTDAPSSPDQDEALENLREEFREIRESMDRDVWARARDHHSDDDVTEDNENS